MSAHLEQLLILQERDIRLQRSQKELDILPHEEKVIADRLAHQSRDFEDLKLKARQIESDRKQLELAVKSKEDSIHKYETQQFQTKKNDEYQALGHEIERARQEIGQTEDKELTLMEQYEQAQKDIVTEGAKVKDYEKVAATRREELLKKKAVLEQQIKDLKAETAELEKQIPAPDLSLYRRILQSKGDIAVVPIIHGTNCNGCHMKLTQQTILQAKGGQKLILCENCGRIVYWQLP
ncbi:MAG: C4-type zinc ribbon domain-containing protein [Methylacidiphilales bacterium]|nr:C4-type zinc ribbon domain-containing protein [Candidatus Methylacidiphilales bacterium]